MPSGLLPRRQHMGSLRAQPRHTAPDRFTLRHRGVRYRGIGAGVVENALGQGTGVGVILVGLHGNRRHSGVSRCGRPQGFPATGYC
jgi:hypothetical protein